MLPATMSIGISSILQDRHSHSHSHSHAHTHSHLRQTHNENEDAIDGATQADETTRLTSGDDGDGRESGYGAGESRSNENENENENENNGNGENADGNNYNNEGDAPIPIDTEADTDTEPAQAPNREQDAIINLTRRLRCMFTAITWPIVPLAVLVVLAFVYMVYGAILDWTASCSHPLHAFTAVSALIICYAPNHPVARAYLFGYHRDMDGPARPLAVRRYDQLVHTLALLYVYAGMTLDQTCREDLSSKYAPENNAVSTATATADSTITTSMIPPLLLDNDSHINSCQVTCPNLYPAVVAYVLTLEVLCWSLLVPLLCLPCIYLWFLRRANSQAHTLADFHDRLREDDEDVRRNGNILAETVMAQLQDVKLVRVYKKYTSNNNNDDDDDDDVLEKDAGAIASADQVLIVPSGVSDLSQGKDANNVLECCICMSDFVIQDAEAADVASTDIETGATTSVALSLPQSPVLPDTETDADAIVQAKKCKHIFHKHCIASWVGGQWRGATLDGDDTPRRARRTTCPLCRNDLR